GRLLSLATGRVPVSLAEVAMGGLALYVLVSLMVVVVRVFGRRRSFRNALAVGALRLVTATALILAAFYLFWGLNYLRPPLASRLGWAPIDRPASDEEAQQQTDEIATLTRQLLAATNDAYREVTGSDDLGRPTDQRDTPTGLDATLEAAYVR